MAKGRQTKGKKVYKKKNTRKHRKTARKMKGGDCGCNKGIIHGGNINSASFNGDLPNRYYYPLNNEINNPNTPSIMVNSRNLPNISSGGSKKRQRKIKGGSYTLLGDAYSTNPLLTFGTIDGSSHSANIVNGTHVVNPSITEQPLIHFSKNNPPLA
jgi:hypothetical protein